MEKFWRARYLTAARRGSAAAAIVAIGVAGCGSSSGPTPASYRAKVDKLCTEINDQISALPASSLDTVAGIERFYAITATGTVEVGAVTAPSSIRASANTWLDSIRTEQSLADQVVGDLKSGKRAQAQALATKGSGMDTHGNAEAKALGLPACAENPQPNGS